MEPKLIKPKTKDTVCSIPKLHPQTTIPSYLYSSLMQQYIACKIPNSVPTPKRSIPKKNIISHKLGKGNKLKALGRT